MERFVVLDVETTGVAFSRGDRIIQLAYAVVENDKVINRYSTYINPERSIPAFIKSLTNISEEDVIDAPYFGDVAPKLLEDLSHSYFVAHNAEFDLGFINEALVDAGYSPFTGPMLDTVELARITFPTEESFRLSRLAESFNMDHENPHRADSDVEATTHLLSEIFRTFSELPLLTLQQLEKLSGKLKSDLGSLLLTWIQNKNLTADEAHIDSFQGIALRHDQKVYVEDGLTGYDESMNIDDFLSSTLGNSEKMNTIIPAYETRQGQIEMITFIDDILSKDCVGLVEAGTGTGKTLAYLIPSAFYAKKTGEPVVVSTETIQLQEQIIKNEIPTLQKILPFQVNTALLKGRSHYLCLQKFENMLRNDPFDSYDRSLSKAQILIWLTKTVTGDVEELSLASGNSRFWQEVASDSSSCSSPSCPWFSRCFYQRAKKKSRHADIIITNHSLLFSDVMVDHQVIPSYSTLIIDEAHHLEETATKQFGDRLDYLTLIQLLNDAGGREKDDWLPDRLSQILDKNLLEQTSEIEEYAKLFRQEWNDLFLLLNQYVTKGTNGKNETGRLSKIIHNEETVWKNVEEAAKRCNQLFKTYLSRISSFVRELETFLETQKGNKGQIALEWLATMKSQLEHQYEMFHHLLLYQEEGSIYWLEVETKGPKQSISVQGCPIHVAEKLADAFFSKKERVILTSATLTVNNKFDYVMDRLGLKDFQVETKQVDSPFSWDDQVSFMVPDDMPLIQEVGEEAYIEAAAIQIYRIAQVTKGKMLVLFTSYDMLKRTYHQLKNMFDETFMLIAQGVQTKSRSKLTKNFQQFDQAILLGTSSFWEGVDIPGDDLSAIVMARLPFSPPNDPVFKARSDFLKEQGKSPFMQLALPQAILRFKQGFGRLIRRSTDRGIVVVLDRRIVTTKYGKLFTRSLPQVPMLEGPMSDLEEHIYQWFYDPSRNEEGNTEELTNNVDDS
ncbi:ATP-dependent helicase DinG [Salipaludibacillus neizhouensis]|uniref:3'-5' exonuclease DinG n=1 Tax=Salipaludibacillus neizhouensis TaxID=885475 RepID=A0A3A9KIP1_9BACI|nr:ATP-dependent DNA helicase DinG [Salipaludibacillus neizhouensis]RKL67555.1 ATP-dependent helicase DinG [Salipaludibacillus neizhouensis]